MPTIWKRPAGVLVLAVATWGGGAAGQATAPAALKNLTLDDIYDPEKKIDFDGDVPRMLSWLDDAHYLWPRTDPKTRTIELLKVNAVSGNAVPLFDAARLEATLTALEGVKPEDAKRAGRQRTYPMNAAKTALLLTVGSDLYHYDLAGHHATRLTKDAAREEEPSTQPGREPGRLRARQQPARGGRRQPAGAGADQGRLRERAEREAGLGVPGGDLRTRQLPRLLVEPRFPTARLPAAGRDRRPALHDRRRHPLPPQRGGVSLPQGRRSEPQGEAGRGLGGRRRARVGGRRAPTRASTS